MIFHDLKCIFIHVPKTAGQSIEQSLFGTSDLFVPSNYEKLKRRYGFGHQHENEKYPRQVSHFTIRQYINEGYVTKKQYEEYWSFAFVRNPYTRLKSMFFYLHEFHKCSYFDEFVGDFLPRVFADKHTMFDVELHGKIGYWFVQPQVNYIFDKQYPVNDVFKFEELARGFQEIKQRLCLSKQLICRNVTKAAQNRTVRLTSKTIDNIISLYSDDFCAFNYDIDVSETL